MTRQELEQRSKERVRRIWSSTDSAPNTNPQKWQFIAPLQGFSSADAPPRAKKKS